MQASVNPSARDNSSRDGVPRMIWRAAAGTALFLFFVGCFEVPATSAEQPELDALASQVAATISASQRSLLVSSTVQVEDFSELHGPLSQLGSYLSDQFEEALENRVHGLVLVSHTKLGKTLQAQMIAPQDFSKEDLLVCQNPRAAITFAVDGYIESLDDTITLWLIVWRVRDNAKIFDRRITLPKTETMQQLLAKSLPVPRPPELHLTDVAEAGQNGVGMPECLSCPSPSFTDEAVKAKVGGKVLLGVVVSPQGIAERIIVLKGAPCGLSRRAFETVQNWKFKPALDANGKPVAVWTLIEVSFRFL